MIAQTLISNCYCCVLCLQMVHNSTNFGLTMAKPPEACDPLVNDVTGKVLCGPSELQLWFTHFNISAGKQAPLVVRGILQPVVPMAPKDLALLCYPIPSLATLTRTISSLTLSPSPSLFPPLNLPLRVRCSPAWPGR